uniref:ubiquitin-protein ligase E3C isoform X1 n=1 Tax=Myxine glutinosa TaxID=7769 RepID=UPI00358F7F7F
MFSFEGDFRTKPKVSLGGASKQEEKSSLLSRTLDERRKREDERRRQRNAVVIQSFVRGCITRCKQHNAQRCIFDEFATRLELAGDVATYSHIAGKLLFFYNESLDTSRLVYVCQGLLRHHTAFLQLLAGPNSLQVLYRLQRLLLLCCRLFRVESEVLAVPLRMVEVFISLESYKAALSCCPPPCVVPQKPPSVAGTASSPLRATVALENVLFYLVRNEYFHYHCCLLNQRLPPHLEYPAPHTVPLASLLVNNLLEPLQLQYTSCGPRSRQRVLCHFIREVLCVPYTEQMHSFLLPALSDRADAFPYTPLLEALHNAGDHDGQCMGMSRATDDAKQMANLRRAGQEGSGFGIPWLELWGSPWLLHAMLTLGERHLGSLLEPHVLLYLRVLQSLLHRLPSSTRAQHTGSGVGDSEDEDDDEQESRMSADKAGPEGRPWEHVVREECLHMLDSREQTSTLLAAVWSPSAGEQVLTVMASICHQLMVDHRVMVPRTRLLYSLAFHPRFLRHLWHLITTLSTTMITGSQVPLLQLLSRGAPLQPCDSSRIVPVFYLFCSLFGHFLISVHDNEFFGDEQSGCNMTPYTNCTKSSMPFSLAELVEMSLRLRDACLGIIQLAYPDSRPELRDSYAQALQGSSVRRAVAQPAEQRLQEQRTRYTHLFKVISNLVKMLKARDARRHFCPRNHWLSQQVTICADRVPQLYMPGTRHVWRSHRLHNIGPLWSTLDVGQDCPPLSVPEERQLAILTELPFVVPFAERVKIFQRLIMVEKEESQGESSFFGGINVVIRRNYIYEDAFDKLSPENEPDLRKQIRVHLLNAHGLDEAGIDGGGIFREFLNELLRAGFNPHQGFFRTTHQGLLYPNPEARLLVGDSFARHYFFLGRILGKALFENMLVELPFASFFLSKLLGTTGDVDIHHLASLDPEMYRNLLFLKTYHADVEELGLNFTVVNNELGEAQVVELKSGGKDIPVTNANRIAYIHLVADYRLNRQMRQHCQAFRQGLAAVIHLEWLRMFDQQELQVLISGAQIPIDLEDLKNCTNYSGGYTAEHPVICVFWHVVERFTDEQKRKLLRFVTSCSRPPLLGFKELYPAFCIHNGGSDSERLPTASTCMNLLKLPEFDEEDTMKHKLLYAIEAAAGFELS